jgi:hypothetical protein
MAQYIDDFGDFKDSVKWDFPENTIPVYVIDKYPYKAKNMKNAEKLAKIRLQINDLCKNLINYRIEWENSTNNQEYIDGVDIFLGIHNEYDYNPYSLPEPFFTIAKQGYSTSRYLLSEIPKSTLFSGLNKPKMRYKTSQEPFVGKDGSGRALYRDVFLDLNQSDSSLKKLVIHELAHTAANHIFFRPDDHHADFKWAENLIKKYWP